MRNQRSNKSHGALALNVGHPLLRNVTNLWVGGEPQKDFINGSYTAYTTGSTLPPLDETDYGFGRKYQGITGYGYYTPLPVTLTTTTPWTEFVVFRYLAAGGTDIALISIAESPLSSTTDRSMHTDNTNKLVGYLYDGVSAKRAFGNTSLTTGNTYVGVVTATGSSLNVYLDGVLDGTTTTANAGFAGYTTPEFSVGMGGFLSTSRANSCILMAGHVYGEAWNAEQVASFARDPMSIVTPRSFNIPWISTEVAGGPAFQPAWARRANQYIGVNFA